MGTSDYLFKLLGKLPPRFVLDGYWSVLQSIEWGILNKENLLKQALTKKWYSLQGLSHEAWNVILNDALTLLVEEDLIVTSPEGYRKTSNFEKLYRLINECIRKKESTRRMVAWALLRLYQRGEKTINVDSLIRELSYPDEVYEELFRFQYSTGLRKKPFLMMSPQERLIKVISQNPELQSLEEEGVIQKIRQEESKGIIQILQKLGVHEDAPIENALEPTRIVLMGCYGSIWPVFGQISLRNKQELYFDLASGHSHRIYVDVLNSAISSVIEELYEVSALSKTPEEFYRRVEELSSESKESEHSYLYPSWLEFKLEKRKSEDKSYLLKIDIKWPQFIEFVEKFSQSNKPMWEKHEYISSCRLPALEIVIRNEMNREKKELEKKGVDKYVMRIQDDVKAVCMGDIKSIEQELSEIAKLIAKMGENSWIFYKTEAECVLPSVLAYHLEAQALVNVLKELAHDGLFPSCYRELRKLLENLSWALFGDYLSLKTYCRHYLLYPSYALFVSKDWYEWVRAKKGSILDLSDAKRRLSELHEMLLKSWNIPGKRKFQDAVFSEITVPSFVVLFGSPLDSDNTPNSVPVFSTNEIQENVISDFIAIGKRLGVSKPEKFAENAFELVTSSNTIIPPYPTNNFVLTLVEKWFNIKGLSKKYGEYSMFVHSYPQSWVVFPFSSVIEVKAFKKELLDVKSLLEGLSGGYEALLKTK